MTQPRGLPTFGVSGVPFLFIPYEIVQTCVHIQANSCDCTHEWARVLCPISSHAGYDLRLQIQTSVRTSYRSDTEQYLKILHSSSCGRSKVCMAPVSLLVYGRPCLLVFYGSRLTGHVRDVIQSACASNHLIGLIDAADWMQYSPASSCSELSRNLHFFGRRPGWICHTQNRNQSSNHLVVRWKHLEAHQRLQPSLEPAIGLLQRQLQSAAVPAIAAYCDQLRHARLKCYDEWVLWVACGRC